MCHPFFGVPPLPFLFLKPCWLGLLIQRDCLVSNFNDIPPAYHPPLPGDRIWARPLIRFPHIGALKSNFFSLSFWWRLLWNPSPCCVSMGGQSAGRMGREVKGRPVGCWSHIKAWKQRPQEPSLQTQIRLSESKCASLRPLKLQISTQEKSPLRPATGSLARPSLNVYWERLGTRLMVLLLPIKFFTSKC